MIHAEQRRCSAISDQLNVLRYGDVARVGAAVTEREQIDLSHKVVAAVIKQAERDVAAFIGRLVGSNSQINARRRRRNTAASYRKVDVTSVRVATLFRINRASRRQPNQSVDRHVSAVDRDATVERHDTIRRCIGGYDEAG